MRDTVIIDGRFCGPSESGNGGYTAGVTAAPLTGDVEVTLRVPPPLNRPLLREADGERARLLDGDTLVAEARRVTLALEVPPAPSLEQARAAEAAFAGHDHHAFPNCFVCGTARKPGDGLRIFTGRVPGSGCVAGTWTPHASLAGDDGLVRPEFLWASIDCPGSWSPDPRPDTLVLGRITGRLCGSLSPGETAIVIGWPLGVDGRKYHVGSALYTSDGVLLACARATWIELRN